MRLQLRSPSPTSALFTRGLVAAIAAAGAVVSTGLSANAADPNADADSLAALVENATPEQAVVLMPTIDAAGQLVANAVGPTQATMPTTGTGEVDVSGPAGQQLRMELPPEAHADGSATVADDGTVVYRGGSEVAVQAQEDGVRVHTILVDTSAATEYTYAFDGLTPLLKEDGTVDLTIAGPDGVVIVLGSVASPWAVDANGAEVPTRYRIEGNAVVQEVDHDSGQYAYPVVADPSVTLGRYVYVRYNRAEVKRIAPYVWTNQFTAVACAAIPNVYAAGACGVAVNQYAVNVGSSFTTAARRNQCVELRFMYVTSAVVGWRNYSC